MKNKKLAIFFIFLLTIFGFSFLGMVQNVFASASEAPVVSLAAFSNASGYICSGDSIGCSSLSSIYKTNKSGNYIDICSSGIGECSSLNSSYRLKIATSSDTTFICSGQSIGCSSLSALYKLTKKDEKTTYVCPGDSLGCSFFSALYKISQQSQGDYYICPGDSVGDCSAFNVLYKFKRTDTDSGSSAYAASSIYSCPSNLIVSGDKCVCAEGYVYNGSSCVTYTQACQAEYGINSYSSGQNACTCINGYAIYNKRCIPISDYCKLTYGEHSIAKTMNGVSNCDCDTGYTWNSNITSCMKIETEPIKLPPVSNPINQKESKDLIELPEYETSIVESEETKEMAQDSNENTQITPNQEVDESMPIKSSNLLAKIGDSIKGFFARILKWLKQ